MMRSIFDIMKNCRKGEMVHGADYHFERAARTALVSEDEQMTRPKKHREREHAHLVERAEALSVLIYILEN